MWSYLEPSLTMGLISYMSQDITLVNLHGFGCDLIYWQVTENMIRPIKLKLDALKRLFLKSGALMRKSKCPHISFAYMVMAKTRIMTFEPHIRFSQQPWLKSKWSKLNQSKCTLVSLFNMWMLCTEICIQSHQNVHLHCCQKS